MRKYSTLQNKKNIVHEQKDTRYICSRCKKVFPDFHNRCPECGSQEWSAYQEENPYARMPLESVIQLCGHAFWLGGTIIFIALLWQTSSNNVEENLFYIYLAIIALVAGILISALYFGLSELIFRIMRLQRRLKAFHEHYRLRYPSITSVEKKSRHTRQHIKVHAKKAISLKYLIKK